MRSALTDRVWPGESFVGSSVGFLVQLKKFHPMNMTIDVGWGRNFQTIGKRFS